MYYVVTWKEKEKDEHTTKIEELREFSTWRKANRYYQKKRRVFEKEWSWVRGLHNPRLLYSEYHPGGYDRDGDGPYVARETIGARTWGPDRGIALVHGKDALKYL